MNFFMLLESYQNHPEGKSLGPNGKSRESDTRGLLKRAHIVANWPPIYIGKESDKHWEEGEDLSLLEFKTIEYKRRGFAIASGEQLKKITKIPNREFMRRVINQHTLQVDRILYNFHRPRRISYSAFRRETLRHLAHLCATSIGY
jgi:hypothetical protein